MTNSAFFRFLIAGAVNTVVTYGIFVILASYMHHTIAYTIAFVLGIALSYAMAAVYVFRTVVTLRSVLRFPFVYVFQYLYGLCVLAILIDALDIAEPLAMLVVIAMSIPLTFVLTRQAMRSPQALQNHAESSAPPDLKPNPTSGSRAEL